MPKTPMDWSPARPPVTVKIKAGHDTNGNPRRGWVVVNSRTGDTVDFVDEGYEGHAALQRKYRDFVEGPVLEVVPSEYRRLKKEARELGKKKGPTLGKGEAMAKRTIPPVLRAWVTCRKKSGVKPGVKMTAREKIDAKACVVREMRMKGK